ncbi:predicted protein [Naegleria gruberi]|uniref:Predicted protein n=1 Tax=Naegleria gruberi TaxID=5762 RepID=D2VS35_NAEGR|nr:uncharacterized protein NAEGRDRAFT_71798 [Naegleria gruberi]EFC40352.1 predicted protein [Naegleria gruberi]|eukprot:XP_002673096.1 predicted protein [Naegleria gruberi strain NEG-M]
MEADFEWSDQLIFSEKLDRDEYWYLLFRTLFCFPLFHRYLIWYQEEDEAEYYNDGKKRQKKITSPPKKKRKNDDNDDNDLSSCSCSSSSENDSEEEEEIITEFSLETFTEFRIPNPFRPNVEVAFKRDGEEFDFEMKYSLAKMAAILTILGSEQYSPNVWTDRVIVSLVNSKEKILQRTEMTIAALCVCIRFDNFEDFYKILFDSEKSTSSKIGISSIYHKEQAKCFVENLDQVAVRQ